MSEFRASTGLTCSAKGCNKMGHWASPNNELGTHSLTTQSGYKYPFCYIHYKLKATSNNLSGQFQTRGVFKVSIYGSNGFSENHILENDWSVISKNTIIQRTAEFAKDIGQIQSAKVSFTRSCGLLTLINCLVYDSKWSIRTLEIIHPITLKTVRLCPAMDYIGSGSTVTFNLC
jgi:hypothetical protein